MSTVTVEEVQARLPELLDRLTPGEEVVITRDGKPVARLMSAGEPPAAPRELGRMKGSVLYMAPDFDATPEEFEEYMS